MPRRDARRHRGRLARDAHAGARAGGCARPRPLRAAGCIAPRVGDRAAARRRRRGAQRVGPRRPADGARGGGRAQSEGAVVRADSRLPAAADAQVPLRAAQSGGAPRRLRPTGRPADGDQGRLLRALRPDVHAGQVSAAALARRLRQLEDGVLEGEGRAARRLPAPPDQGAADVALAARVEARPGGGRADVQVGDGVHGRRLAAVPADASGGDRREGDNVRRAAADRAVHAAHEAAVRQPKPRVGAEGLAADGARARLLPARRDGRALRRVLSPHARQAAPHVVHLPHVPNGAARPAQEAAFQGEDAGDAAARLLEGAPRQAQPAADGRPRDVDQGLGLGGARCPEGGGPISVGTTRSPPACLCLPLAASARLPRCVLPVACDLWPATRGR